MPKEARKRVASHTPTVKLNNRQSINNGNTDEHVEFGEAIEVLDDEINQQSPYEEPRNTISKKEKQQLKREALLRNLGFSQLPSSRSHNRRMKRKAKEQIAGGFGDIRAVITSLDGDMPQSAQGTTQATINSARKKGAAVMGKIGEGRDATLSKAQRKHTLQTEQLRHPLILSNPEFVSNPFSTIRTHAQNTLVKH